MDCSFYKVSADWSEEWSASFMQLMRILFQYFINASHGYAHEAGAISKSRTNYYFQNVLVNKDSFPVKML